MAAAKKQTAEPVETPKKTVEAPQEPEYTVEEFAEASSMFGASPDIVTAALRVAGVKRTTKSAAEKIINQFRKKEVK